MATSRRSFAASLAGAALSLGAARRAHPLEAVGRENIKVTDVKITLLSYELPPEKRWMTGTFLVWKTDSILVEVFTDKGIAGIGESSPYGGPEAVKKFIEENIRPGLIGKNPFDVEHLAGAWLSGSRGARIAWAGVDAALWDIIGKAKGQPVYKLLCTEGKPDPHIRMYASGGVEYAWYKRPDDLIDEAVRHKESGYTAFKFRIGTEWKRSNISIKKYIPYLVKMRQAVGPNFDLIQEVNMRWTLEECLEICPVLEELKFLWFEEPVNQRAEGAIDAYIRISRALPKVMVSGGEQLVTRTDFKEWIDRDAYDIVQPDCNTTGLTEAWHIARIAHLRGKYCCPHNWHGGLTTMANAALVAAIPNHLMLELNQTSNPLKEEVFKDPLVVKKGYMDLPNRPGFGVEVIADAARKFPYIPGHYMKPNPDLPS
ncbi:MAG: mandelate racemase/muconate lactonizing enzyme family protein [Acidobacteriota bacterium]